MRRWLGPTGALFGRACWLLLWARLCMMGQIQSLHRTGQEGRAGCLAMLRLLACAEVVGCAWWELAVVPTAVQTTLAD